MKQITFEYEGKDYTLEYTRNSVRTMERRGFISDDIVAKPMTVVPDLFAGAFLSKHPQVKREKIDKIYDSLNGKSKLITALIEMYNDTIETLLGDDEDAGNANWTPNWETDET